MALLHETTSLCAECKNAVPARVTRDDFGAVWLEKTCSMHGSARVCISTDASWYEATRAIVPRFSPPRRAPRDVRYGCPFDCGACTAHAQGVRLPVVTITSACNLACPICYVHNKNEGAFHMPVAEFRDVIARLREDADGGELDIVNITGGEPTLHPELFAILLAAKDAGVHRVTVCTNGLKLAKDEAFVAKLAELGARVALSFDTFDDGVDVAMQGAKLIDAKMRALDLLEKHDVGTTLIPVMTKGMNDREIGRIVDLSFARPNIRHLEVHTITYTGQGGKHFPRAGRISMVEVLDRIAQETLGLVTREDFVPSPCAHPLCYQIAYLLLDPAGGKPVSVAKLIGRDALYDCLSERLYLEPSAKLEAAMKDGIDRLWTSDDPEAARALGLLRRLLGDLFPKGRPITQAEALAASERACKAIYVHAHMDEETFDTERLAQCCDSNCYADGTTIPVCAYNVIYREKEARFMHTPRPWSAREGGAVYADVSPRKLKVLS